MADSKPVKQEVSGTVILPFLVFHGVAITAYPCVMRKLKGPVFVLIL